MSSQVNANQELFLDILTKEEKEALLTKKMEEIRKKNEALRKRHEEIEAEKRAVSGGAKNAASPRKETKPLPGEETPKESADGKKERPRQPKPAGRGRSPNKGARDAPRAQGPPPDPAYNFLSDRYRHGERQMENPKGEFSRRHPKNYGGEDFGNVKNRMRKERDRQDRGRGGPPRSKMEMSINMTGRERREYVEWKAEREKVDQARIDRQKSASGEWKREWDVKKDEEVAQRVEPGKRPGNLAVVRTNTAGRIGSGRFDRGDRDERPLGPGRKDSKESQGKPQANGVAQERLAEKDASAPRPVGRGRGRGRARNKGGSTGNDPGRVRTYSGEDRHVECKKDLLVIKVDNTPGKKSDQVEVEYSDGENEPHCGDQAEAHQKKAGPHAEELWWDEEGDDIGLELQGISAEDEIFEQKELFDDYHEDGLDGKGCFEDAPGQPSQGDEDEWEDCTTSEDFSTDRSQSQTSVSDDLSSPLKVNLNPDAPVFTPTSPISPNPLSTRLSKELKLEEKSSKQKKSEKKKKDKEEETEEENTQEEEQTLVEDKTPVDEQKAPLDSNEDVTEHSKSDSDHLDSEKISPVSEELVSASSEKESEGGVSSEKPTLADSETPPKDPAVKAGSSPQVEGTSDKCQTQQDPPAVKETEEETARNEAGNNSQTEVEADVKNQQETNAENMEDTEAEAKKEEDQKEDKEATPTPQGEGEESA
ncbi:coiled-coil domain-containing protein 9 isoform X6 [Magallana gigas]|uniref:coiled-coil domain-containing protein 9 isoform X6 n=1 Tax=Magallana gigas TaxID=29159 RepID=UPI0033426482